MASTLPPTSFTYNTLQVSRYLKFKFGDKIYRFVAPTAFDTLAAGVDVALNSTQSATYYIFGNTAFVHCTLNVTPAATTFTLTGLPAVAATGTYNGIAVLDGAANDIAVASVAGATSTLTVTYGAATAVAYSMTLKLAYQIAPEN